MDDITMIISYEDRLRLSELAGELTKYQWAVDNMWIANFVYLILAMLGGVLLVMFIRVIVFDDMFYDFKHENLWTAILAVALVIIVPVIIVLIAHEFDVMEVNQIQAQIDEIYRIYGYESGGGL